MADEEWAERQRQLTAAGLLVLGKAAQGRIQRLSDISSLIEAAQRSNVVMLNERTVEEMLTLVPTEEQGTLPLEWLALLVTAMLLVGGFFAYARPRRRVAAGLGQGLGREALILEVARIDNLLAEAPAPPRGRSEILERRAALLALLRDD